MEVTGLKLWLFFRPSVPKTKRQEQIAPVNFDTNSITFSHAPTARFVAYWI